MTNLGETKSPSKLIDFDLESFIDSSIKTDSSIGGDLKDAKKVEPNKALEFFKHSDAAEKPQPEPVVADSGADANFTIESDTDLYSADNKPSNSAPEYAGKPQQLKNEVSKMELEVRLKGFIDDYNKTVVEINRLKNQIGEAEGEEEGIKRKAALILEDPTLLDPQSSYGMRARNLFKLSQLFKEEETSEAAGATHILFAKLEGLDDLREKLSTALDDLLAKTTNSSEIADVLQSLRDLILETDASKNDKEAWTSKCAVRQADLWSTAKNKLIDADSEPQDIAGDLAPQEEKKEEFVDIAPAISNDAISRSSTDEIPAPIEPTVAIPSSPPPTQQYEQFVDIDPKGEIENRDEKTYTEVGLADPTGDVKLTSAEVKDLKNDPLELTRKRALEEREKQQEPVDDTDLLSLRREKVTDSTRASIEVGAMGAIKTPEPEVSSEISKESDKSSTEETTIAKGPDLATEGPNAAENPTTAESAKANPAVNGRKGLRGIFDMLSGRKNQDLDSKFVSNLNEEVAGNWALEIKKEKEAEAKL